MPRGGGVPRSAKEANNPILLKVQSLQLSFRPAGVSLGGGGGGGPRPPLAPPCVRPCYISENNIESMACGPTILILGTVEGSSSYFGELQISVIQLLISVIR